jgi:multidrug resistance efflux pump
VPPPPGAPAIQPVQPRPIGVTPARMLALEEEVETLEAHREAKKAYVRAAELTVRRAELNLARLADLLAKAAITKDEVERAKLDVEMAKAQVDIHAAEQKEVEVKLKYAKKRLEDAKAAGVRPVPPPGVRPVPVDPPPVGAADPKAVENLKTALARIQAHLEMNAAALKEAEAGLKTAERRFGVVLKAAEKGPVEPVALVDLAVFRGRMNEARNVVERLAQERKVLEDVTAELQMRLKEIEK